MNKEAQAGKDCGDSNSGDDTVEGGSQKGSDMFHYGNWSFSGQKD